MHFLKEKDNKIFHIQQVKGNITNSFYFTIKDLYKKDAHRIQDNIDMLDCLDCGMFLCGPICSFCGIDSQEKLNENTVKNWSVQRQCEEEEVSIECMILMVDISGSMNITYPSTFQKINKQYIIRVIGIKNFQILKNALGQQQVVKNFKGVQTLLQAGQSIKNVAWTLKQEIIRQRKLAKKPLQKNKQQILEYISRKEIIQFGVAHYVNTIKTKRPNTVITVVYFNANIQYPINNFVDLKVLGGIDTKTLDEMIQAGRQAAEQISLSNINEMGDSLITNMTKAEAEGPTAMTPCLAFCLGMATKWKHDLHQIVIVTDGLSNVGFGQTEEESELQKSKIIYEQLANKYAIKSNCVVNIISFQECAIGYDVIDEIVKRTGGVPYCIGFQNKNNQLIANNDTVSYLNFQMTTGFCQSTKQFCYDNKLVIKISSPLFKIRIPEQLKQYVKIDKDNWKSFNLGVKSVNQNFQFGFYVDPEFDIQSQLVLKLTVAHQYRRNKKISYIIRQQLLKIRPGNKEKAIQNEVTVLRKQIEQKLRKKLNQDNFQDYEAISKKMQKLQVIEKIDNEILQKFNKKKAILQQYDKGIDKLNKDKRAIQSRRKQTYSKRKYSEEDIFS